MSLGKIFKNLTHSLVALFALLIIGYFILNFLANKGLPGISTGAQWVEQHSQPGY